MHQGEPLGCVCICVCVRMCNPAHGAFNHPFAVEETYNPRWYPTGNCHTCYTSHTLRIREQSTGRTRRLFPVETSRAGRAGTISKDVSPIHSRNPNTPPSGLSHSHQHYSAPLVSTEGDAHEGWYRQDEIEAPSAASLLGGARRSPRGITTCILARPANAVGG